MIAALLLAAALQAPPEIVAAVQVHGNTVTGDDDVRRISGVTAGDRFDETTLSAATERLRASKKFEQVEVLKRFASITDPSQVLIVIVVDEGPVDIRRTNNPDQPVEVVHAKKRINLMFLPLLSVEDGYGFTYGALFARPGVAGTNSRVSFPLTWGGDKRAAVEFEKGFNSGPLHRVAAGLAASRRENPFYEADDNRVRVWVRGERQLVKYLRAGATAGSQRASFPAAGTGPRETDTFQHGGADLTLDTRIDPVLPRNAVYTRAAWEHIAGVNRTDFDARSYVGLLGQSVAQFRVMRSDSDAPLPPYLKPLLGGMSNLRGFATGTAVGDTLLATSAELVVPLTSPLSVGRLGVSAFVDAGAAYDEGQRLEDQTWRRGYGGSVWFSAAFLRLNIAVAHGRGSSTRVHVGMNASF